MDDDNLRNGLMRSGRIMKIWCTSLVACNCDVSDYYAQWINIENVLFLDRYQNLSTQLCSSIKHLHIQNVSQLGIFEVVFPKTTPPQSINVIHHMDCEYVRDGFLSVFYQTLACKYVFEDLDIGRLESRRCRQIFVEFVLATHTHTRGQSTDGNRWKKCNVTPSPSGVQPTIPARRESRGSSRRAHFFALPWTCYTRSCGRLWLRVCGHVRIHNTRRVESYTRSMMCAMGKLAYLPTFICINMCMR